jgi:hypothetical protein
MDGPERELFAAAVGRATAGATGATLDAALLELGWADALASDPATAVAELFEAQGAATATSSSLDDVLAAGLGRDRPGAPVLLPALGGHRPPGALRAGQVRVQGLLLANPDPAGALAVVARGEEGDTVLEVPAGALTRRPVGGLDPTLGLVEVVGSLAVTRDQARGPAPWADALALGQLALGHELVGASRTMLALAREHALARVQFGRPIASFQAVRHRLAEGLVAVEAAAALLAAAWENGPTGVAAAAKSLAGRSARTVARHAQQVLAGVGFTTEHPFHRSVRRVLVLDQLLGSSTALGRELGAGLLDGGPFPPSSRL